MIDANTIKAQLDNLASDADRAYGVLSLYEMSYKNSNGNMNKFELHRQLQHEDDRNTLIRYGIEQEIINSLECPICHQFHRIHVYFEKAKNLIECYECRLCTGVCATIEEALDRWNKIGQVIREQRESDKTEPNYEKQS